MLRSAFVLAREPGVRSIPPVRLTALLLYGAGSPDT